MRQDFLSKLIVFQVSVYLTELLEIAVNIKFIIMGMIIPIKNQDKNCLYWILPKWNH